MLGLSEALGCNIAILDLPMRLTRTGRALRLVHRNGRAAAVQAPDRTLLNLILKARSWLHRPSSGDINIEQLAELEKVTPGYVKRIVRLAFLAPPIVDAITNGTQPTWLDGKALNATDTVLPSWSDQTAQFEAGRR